jgi:hypothetical protein
MDNEQDSAGDTRQNAYDLGSRINGLMGTMNRRTAERDAALAELESMKVELAAARAALSESEPSRAPGNPPKSFEVPTDRDPLAPMRDTSWEAFGFRNPHR